MRESAPRITPSENVIAILEAWKRSQRFEETVNLFPQERGRIGTLRFQDFWEMKGLAV